jgi:hypothetical protein
LIINRSIHRMEDGSPDMNHADIMTVRFRAGTPGVPR